MLVIVSGLSIAIGVLVDLRPGYSSFDSSLEVFTTLAICWVFAGVGAVILNKQPLHGVGWALMLAGAAFIFETLFLIYVELAVFASPEAGYPAGGVAVALGSPMWAWIMGGVFLLMVYFPSGRAPNRFMAVLVRTTITCFALISVAIALSPTFDPPYSEVRNPLGVDTAGWLDLLLGLAIAGSMFGILAAGIHLLVRFRRSRGDERQQHKWLAGAVVALLASMPYGFVGNFSGTAGLVVVLALLALPLSVGVAVLRYRLYEIDRLINRGLVYVSLTAALGATYAGLVIVLQLILSPISGDSGFAIAGTTIVVAGLFVPVRRAIQNAVDRRFNRRSYDAARAVEEFAAHLRNQIEIEALQVELFAVIDATVQPRMVSLWLRPG